MDFIAELELAFRQNANPEAAVPMAAYMKNLFPYLGLKNDTRKSLQKPLLAKHSAEIKSGWREIAWQLWQLPEREFQYAAMDILAKETKKNFSKEDIELIEKLLVSRSWWDSVDFLAKHVLGNYLAQFQPEIPKTVKRFSDSADMWLNRSAILFQLGYKSRTDEEILFQLCRKHAPSKEFFIRKAIGWALREYAKTNPEAVKKFVSETELSGLSQREALKNL